MTISADTSDSVRMRLARNKSRGVAATAAAMALVLADPTTDDIKNLAQRLDGSKLSLSDLHELASILMEDASTTVSSAPSQAHPPSQSERRPAPSLRDVWKLNVHYSHLDAVLTSRAFGVDKLSAAPGDLALLQFTKGPAPDPHQRVTHYLVIERVAPDSGDESTKLWGRHWPYLVHAADVVAVDAPFSLEDLDLVGRYSVQGKIGPERIRDVDIPVVLAALGIATE
jgi:hypothetical protein